MTRKKTEYTTVKIPVELAKEIDQIIEELHLGYRHRSEFVVETIRNKVIALRSKLNRHSTDTID